MNDPASPGTAGTNPPSSLTPFLRALRTRDTEAIARMRHSLRTPLNQIIGYSEMLMESANETGATPLLRDLKRIHTGGGQLLALINDALANWKIEAGTIDVLTLRREMRTPLNAVVGYTEHCLETDAARANTELSSDLRKIRLSAQHLYELFMSETLEDELTSSMGADPSGLANATLGPIATLQNTSPSEILGEGASTSAGHLLVVDDDQLTREMLSRRLQRLGYVITQAADGREALQRLREQRFDLVLLDILMPVLDGFQTLESMRADASLRFVPVIMLTALDDVESTVRCIEAGAADYVPKPFNPVVLRARINAALEKKRLHDQEQAYVEQISRERAKSDRLLLNVLPKAVADRLKAGERTIVDSFADATVLFADIVDFSQFSSQHPPARTVQLLNDIFSSFDTIAEHNLLEKIKTIGDAYMLVGGIPVVRPDHAIACADAALEMLQAIRVFNRRHGFNWNIRIGINTGPVVAGIIGTRKFTYDLWGDTVNIASRMESQGKAGRIQISSVTHHILGDAFVYERVGMITLKNVGEMETYFLLGRA
ncbi:MAG: adenylate/guanylate cyclase domain-containing protein [Opitutales bacterium]